MALSDQPRSPLSGLSRQANWTRPGWLAWQLVNGLLVNTVVALVLWIMMPWLAGFWVMFIHSQFIGFAIRSLVFLCLMRNVPGQRPPVLRTVLAIAASTAGGLVIGTLLASWVTGSPVFFLDTATRAKTLTPILLITALASLIATAYFWSREHMATLQARSQADHALAEQASRQASEAQLRMLRAQLEPHMLFNTLANLRALMSVDPQAAQQMLDRLIAFLRATLASSRTDRVSLKDEFALLDDYLQLIAIRMADRMQFSLDLPDELASVPVLPLLLQPLVENAVRHGLEPSLDGGRIDIRACREGTGIRIEVADTGAGLALAAAAPSPEADGGFGLQQIRERLDNAYAGRARLDLIPNTAAGQGTVAVLHLPGMEAR